ncbi:probable BOI-related E3 ubiquitin-protein ligase 3 [Rutidosis leptorrhynchoides]|uniref:probable BOI-related E3 ubiquitin-protein ligase 3 n=1 Tax=Rutidosis leptorrhynchoides TaxID=125765 RepID=UPI003A9947A1
MAVQAQLYSDHYNYNYQNNNMGFSQDWHFSSVFDFGNENKNLSSSPSSSYQHHQDQSFLMNSASGYHQNLVSSSNSRRNGMIGFQNLSSELERQRLEMDCFLHFQNEKLKAVLNEETRKREMLLMQSYELKMKAIMDAKDEVLSTATSRTKELENYLLMAEKESKNWEKKAIENEAMMTDLNRKINQVIETKQGDAESVCGGGGGDDDHEEKERQKRMVCKMCHVRSSCVLLLPCRHLCCCRFCEGLLMFCPMCETVKNGSLEVYFGLN